MTKTSVEFSGRDIKIIGQRENDGFGGYMLLDITGLVFKMHKC